MNFYRPVYHALIGLGRPIGGIRPRRVYDWLGRRAYPAAEPKWVKDRWGIELLLSHHYHIDRNILIYGDYDHSLQVLIERRVKPGMVVMDVGANLGEMALHMGMRVGAGGVVHAFEPMPAALGRLREHIERNGMGERVKAWGVALGEVTGEMEMGVPGVDADNQGLGSVVNVGGGGAGGERIKVPAMRLDDFCGGRGGGEMLERIDFIKLDIQGGEWFFLGGAREVLGRCRPEMVMEVSPGDLRAVGRTSRDLLGMVRELGYRVFGIRDGEAGREIREEAADFAATNVLCVPK